MYRVFDSKLYAELKAVTKNGRLAQIIMNSGCTSVQQFVKKYTLFEMMRLRGFGITCAHVITDLDHQHGLGLVRDVADNIPIESAQPYVFRAWDGQHLIEERRCVSMKQVGGLLGTHALDADQIIVKKNGATVLRYRANGGL